MDQHYRKQVSLGHFRSVFVLVVCLMGWYAFAQADDTFAGRTISLIVGFSPGGAYDLYARVLARHIPKHLPGHPTVIVQNMPGAGGIKAANYLYQVAPKDGSVLGTFARGVVIGPLFGEGAFDATKFSWLGSISDDVNVCLAWHTSSVKVWGDLLTKPFIAAGQGAQADPDVYANLIKNLFHAPIKLVSGYPGSNDIILAMERGEVDGVCALSYSTIKAKLEEKIKNKDINIIFQAGVEKTPDLPDVPLLSDLAQGAHQLEIMKLIMGVQGMARPFVAPPGLTAKTKDMLRTAFSDTMSDPAFMDEAKKLNLEVHATSGSDIDGLVADLYRTPHDIVVEAKQAIAEP